ncbi:MAG: hypothetical protein ACJ75B_08360 [Flavisolibacter sp.]
MRLLLIISSLLLGQTLFSQEKALIFQNFGTPSTFGIDTFYSQKIHEVTLNPDKTFEFWSRPHISCFTWHEYKGIWKREKDTLIFSDRYEVKEEDTKASYKNDSRQSFLITFKTDKNSVLRNKKIKVQYVYDYDAHLDEPETIFDIKLDNTIEIPFKNIPNFNKLSALRIEYELNFKETRYNYLTLNNPLNNKKTDVPNIINVEFVERPKSEIVYRTTRGVVKKDTLIIVSTNKTKTILPDYNRDIEFENNFVLRK